MLPVVIGTKTHNIYPPRQSTCINGRAVVHLQVTQCLTHVALSTQIGDGHHHLRNIRTGIAKINVTAGRIGIEGKALLHGEGLERNLI